MWMLLYGVGGTALAALWWLLRLTGQVRGPSGSPADYIVFVPPLTMLLMGALSLGAARNDELPAHTPQRLALRLPFVGGEESGRALPGVFVVSTAAAMLLSFLMVVSLFPKGWSESWECHTCSDGDGSCCDLIDGTWYQYVVFIPCCIVVPLWALGGPIAGFLGVRFLRRRRRQALPIVEVSKARLVPGERLDLCAMVHGDGPVRGLTIKVECHESATYDQGSSSSTDTALVHEDVLDERGGFVLQPGAALVLDLGWQVPRRAMHTFKAASNTIGWALAVKLETTALTLEQRFDLVIAPSAPGNFTTWRAS